MCTVSVPVDATAGASMSDRFVRNFPAKAMAQGFIEGVRFVSPDVAGALFIVEDHDTPVPPWSYDKRRESHGMPYQPQQRWAVMRKDVDIAAILANAVT